MSKFVRFVEAASCTRLDASAALSTYNHRSFSLTKTSTVTA